MMISAKSIPLTRSASDLNTGNLGVARLPVSGMWSLSAGLTISGFPVTIASLIGSKIYPAADSTTALQLNKADGTTNVLNVDTTNGRVGIGTTDPGAYKLNVSGAVYGQSFSTAGIVISQSGTIYKASDGRGGIKQGTLTAGGAYPWTIYSGDAASYSGGYLSMETTGAERVRINSDGNVGIRLTAPTAYLHLKAGTATASTAPIKLTKGVLNTTAEIGAIEFTDDDTTGALYITLNVAGVLTRKQFAFV
jgi:hypothetical protein